MTASTSSEFSPTLQSRYEQAFWALTPEEVEPLKRFGDPVRFAAGDKLFTSGSSPPGMYILLKATLLSLNVTA